MCILHWDNFATGARLQVAHGRRKVPTDVLGSTTKRISVQVRVPRRG
jgi:hypothetical protein